MSVKNSSFIFMAGGLVLSFIGLNKKNSFFGTKTKTSANPREKHFMHFASMQFNKQFYMTPEDFLRSIVNDDEVKITRKVLSIEDIENFKKSKKSIKENSTRFFRNMGNNGIISYYDYLFLLSLLKEPQSMFQMAFNVLDKNEDTKLEKEEFLILENVVAKIKKKRKSVVDTSIVTHFFGEQDKKSLNFKDFKTFLENFQSEIYEVEFLKFSEGSFVISEVDFAKLLLSRTSLTSRERDTRIRRVLNLTSETKGITLHEYMVFRHFLNNLKDLTLALNFYLSAGHLINEKLFHRAVKTFTGMTLSSHLVHIIFVIFDDNGDGYLSYTEFIAVMNDYLYRGLKINRIDDKLKAFMVCLARESKNRYTQ